MEMGGGLVGQASGGPAPAVIPPTPPVAPPPSRARQCCRDRYPPPTDRRSSPERVSGQARHEWGAAPVPSPGPVLQAPPAAQPRVRKGPLPQRPPETGNSLLCCLWLQCPGTICMPSSKNSCQAGSKTTVVAMHGGPASSGGIWAWPSLLPWTCRRGGGPPVNL